MHTHRHRGGTGMETAECVLVTSVQITDRVTGKVFSWSSEHPLRVYVYPRQEPGTITPHEKIIPLTYAAINPVNGLVSPVFLEALVRVYIDGSIFKKP